MNKKHASASYQPIGFYTLRSTLNCHRFEVASSLVSDRNQPHISRMATNKQQALLVIREEAATISTEMDANAFECG